MSCIMNILCIVLHLILITIKKIDNSGSIIVADICYFKIWNKAIEKNDLGQS
jgi:hypothetical protein